MKLLKLFFFKRRLAIAAGVILLGLFLVRPGVSRLKARIANSISRAVARPAEIGAVHLRFLPQPGFDLGNLVIYEDPAFGAEPMLRAPEVTAVVRLTSLLRGRLDISRLELTEPSLNLVRRADGRWNWEDLLEHTARTPLAPTAKSKSEARPGFPYIEASSGRINFKAGQEKKPYALLNADFALWQESENTWGARLKAEPLRTDMSLNDAGLLRMNGTWQRAGSLRETPLQFSLEWDRAQLGQLTKLVSGNDKGWRGEVRLDATLSGMPAAMQVAMDTSIQDFHRYDISSSEGLRLTAHCEGRYSSVEAMMHEVFCNAPVGNGMVTLHGDAGLPGVHRVDLALNLESVPVSAVAQVARRAKKNLPADLASTGNIQGSFTVKEEGVSARGPEFQGRGEITNLRLQSTTTRVEFAPGSVPFVLSPGRTSIHAASRGKPARWLDGEVLPAPDELHVEYGPFPVALGRPVPAQARGWLGRSGYGMVLRGEGEVSHALRLANLLGLPAVKASAEGVAEMKLQIAGSWAGNISGSSSGFSLPEANGTVQLHNVRAALRGVNGLIEISSAELHLSPDETRVEKLSAQAGDAHWTGSVALPRGCGMPGACLVRFNLNSKEIGLSELSSWLGSQPSQRRWYQMLTSEEPMAPTFLENLRASGKVSAGRLRIRNLVAERVSASLELEHGKLQISELRADLLGGKHRGDWQADFTTGSPVYTGSGTLTGISLGQMADAMHDPWISGTAGGTYQLTASGADSATFWESAEGEVLFDVRDGILAHISLASDEGPLRAARWQGRAQLRGGKIEIEKGKLDSPAGTYEISGTASLERVLDLKLILGTDAKPARAGSLVYSVTGTVAEPRVTLTTPETQARLKP
ncbi:MAG: AsmA family protein [Candidatus Sulfotelmatobacter sp.]